MEQIDLAIIGSGPAGYTASIYASRYKLNNVVFGKAIGGTIADAHKVCNYPGYEEISGMELGSKMSMQAKNLGGIQKQESVESIERSEGMFIIKTDKDEYQAKGVILATGTKRSKLMLPNEEKYLGKGVSYCATCDAMFFREKVVAVIGGSDAATTAALLLSETSKHVYIIYRGDALKGDPTWVENVLNTSNIEVVYKTVVTGLNGQDVLESLSLSNEFKGSKELSVNGIFIEIGSEPNADIAMKLGLKLTDKGYVVVDGDQSTNIDGIWAAGDITTNSNGFQQVITACAEGAVAANSAYCYIKKMC